MLVRHEFKNKPFSKVHMQILHHYFLYISSRNILKVREFLRESLGQACPKLAN